MSHKVVVSLVAVAAVLILGASVEAQVKPFKITGEGVGPKGLPLPPMPGQPAEARPHCIVGEATHLGRHDGAGSVRTDSANLNPDGTITGEFGGGSPFVFVGANGDELVTWYGRTDHGAEAPGTFTLTILDVLPGGFLVVEAHWIAEFVVQPDESTGKFAGATGSWIMDAFSEPFILGSSEPVAYRWEGEGEITFAQ